ncbi:triadin [Cricetulus griseus]
MTTAYDTQLFAGEIGFNSDSMGLEPPFISSVFGASSQQTSLLSDIINIMWRKSKKGGISSYLKLHFTNVKSLGNASTTTTVIDNKNGSVPKSPGKVLKRTVTEDIVTTFSSPAAWLLVIALIITWSAVAIVMFDLVDYKNFSASSIAKIGSDPLKFVNDAVEETSDWIYGFFSLLSDIISSEGDEEDEDADEDIDKGTQGSELYPTAMTGNWKHLTFAS